MTELGADLGLVGLTFAVFGLGVLRPLARRRALVRPARSAPVRHPREPRRRRRRDPLLAAPGSRCSSSPSSSSRASRSRSWARPSTPSWRAARRPGARRRRRASTAPPARWGRSSPRSPPACSSPSTSTSRSTSFAVTMLASLGLGLVIGGRPLRDLAARARRGEPSPPAIARRRRRKGERRDAPSTGVTSTRPTWLPWSSSAGGFLTMPAWYRPMAAELRDRGAADVVIAPIYTPDWVLCAVRGLGPVTTRAGRSLLAAGERSAASPASRGAPILYVGHSAGGMLGRLLTSPEPFEGRRLGASDRIGALVTLGTPHLVGDEARWGGRVADVGRAVREPRTSRERASPRRRGTWRSLRDASSGDEGADDASLPLRCAGSTRTSTPRPTSRSWPGTGSSRSPRPSCPGRATSSSTMRSTGPASRPAGTARRASWTPGGRSRWRCGATRSRARRALRGR